MLKVSLYKKHIFFYYREWTNCYFNSQRSISYDDITKMKPITPSYDPWEAYMDLEEYGKLLLTNVEFTTTTLCNMRCEHCAVGYTLQPKDPNPLPMDLLLKRLDEIPHLRSLSITGGEPMLSKNPSTTM